MRRRREKLKEESFYGISINKIFILIILLYPIFYFAPLLSPSKMMYGSDWLLNGWPLRNWYRQTILTYKQFPLWNPYIFGGITSDTHSLYTLFYLILPVHIVWTYLFVMGVFLAGLGTYLYLKELKISSYGSFVGAIIYMGSGSILSMTYPGHEAKTMAAALFPFILLFLHKGIVKRKCTHFLIAGGIGGLAALHAHFQLVYYAFYALFSYFIVHLIWNWRENKFSGTIKLSLYALSGLLLGASLASAKFLPIFGSFGWGLRGGVERGYKFATSWSLPALELFDLITPHFSGILNNYWGENYFKLDTQYLGILPIILVMLAFLGDYRSRYKKFFIVLGAITILFTLGGHTPFYYIPYYIMPGVKKLRGPVMAFYLVAFSVAFLSAYGIDKLINIPKRDKKHIKRVTLALSLLTGLILISLILCNIQRETILESIKSHLQVKIAAQYGQQLLQQKIDNLYGNYPEFLKGLSKTFILVVINSLLILLLVKRKLKVAPFLLIAIPILLFDQWSIEKKFLKSVSHPREYYARDEIVNYLNKDKEIYRIFPLYYDHTKDLYLISHGIQSLGGIIANPFKRYQELIGAGKSVMFNPLNLVKYRNLLNILNAKYVIALTIPEDLSQFEEETRKAVEKFKNNFAIQWGISWDEFRKGLKLVFHTRRGYAIYLNESYLPRVWLVPDYEVLAKEKVLERLKEPDFDPRRTVLLEENPEVPHSDKQVMEGTKVRIEKYTPNRVIFEVNSEAPAFLVFSDNWHPYWKVYVDGKRKKIYIADYILKAVYIEKGQHKIEFKIESLYINLGLLLSIAGFLNLLILVLIPIIRKQSRP